MKTGVLRGVKNSLLLFLLLLLIQLFSSMLTGLVTLIFGILHPVGPTPLWQWIINGALTCLFWLWMGWYTSRFVQLKPVGAVAVLTIWSMLTSLMRNMYLFLLPQRICGGMLRQIFQFFQSDSSVLLDDYWDLPTGCFLLSVALGVGLLLSRKHPKASHEPRREIA